VQLEPYIFFHGTCEEALTFYKQCFGGEIVQMSVFNALAQGGNVEMPSSHE